MIDPAKLNPVPWLVARLNERSTWACLFAGLAAGAAAANAVSAPWSYVAFIAAVGLPFVADGKVVG